MAAITLSTVRPWKACTVDTQAWSRWRNCDHPGPVRASSRLQPERNAVNRLSISCLSATLRLWGCMFSICSA